MDLDFDGAAARGLRSYVRLVASRLGLHGDCFYLDLHAPLNAYLALAHRLPMFPDRDLALIWDERHGWAAALETDAGKTLLVVSHLGIEVLPPPEVVAQFVVDLVAGGFPLPPGDPPGLRAVDAKDDLPDRLAHYSRPALAEFVR